MESITGMTARYTQVSGKIINLMVKVSIRGTMAVDTMDTGKTISFMDKERSSTKTAEPTKDNLKTT